MPLKTRFLIYQIDNTILKDKEKNAVNNAYSLT